MLDYSTSELKVFQFILHIQVLSYSWPVLFWVSSMKVYYVCIILIDISTKGTLLHFKVYINFLLSSPFWPFEYLKPLNKTSAIFSVVPALVPWLPPPCCVLLHPAQRGQPVQLAHQLRQVRTLCYLSPGDHALVTGEPCCLSPDMMMSGQRRGWTLRTAISIAR